MKDYSMKQFYLLMGVGILCLIVLVFTATYAFFRPRIVGEGELIDVRAGIVKLNMEENKIELSNALPIRDTTKDTKAAKNEFSISRTNDSNIATCYDLYLVVDNIGSNLKNKWFKYELTYGDSQKITGNFASFDTSSVVVKEKDGDKTGIKLLSNQELSDDNSINNYILRLWLSYSETEDQTSVLQGEEADRMFEAHIYASGKTGSCGSGASTINDGNDATNNTNEDENSNDNETNVND